MSLAIRVRHPAGASTLRFGASDTVADLMEAVAQAAGIPPQEQAFRVGFPPKPLEVVREEATLAEWGLSNGEALAVERLTSAGGGGGGAHAAAPAPNGAGRESSSAQAAPSRRPADSAQAGRLPADDRRVVRRVIVSDNSCLFNAIGYNLDRSRREGARLRRVVASAVERDPATFNDGFLEMSNGKYVNWILKPEKWGGPIELHILASHYQCEMAAFDIQTGRCDIYGQGRGFPQRCLLLFDGLHYDALAVQAFPDAPEEVDCTLFETSSIELPAIMDAAEALVRSLQQRKQFTDTNSFTLQCAVCYEGLVGAAEARAHAAATGHQNFQEYRA